MSEEINELLEKEKEVKLSRIKHNLLETELTLLRKKEEVKRLEEEVKKYKKRLAKES